MAIDGYIIYTDTADIKAFTKELSAIGRNINQIAKRIDVYKRQAMLIGNGTAQLQQHGGFAHARLTAQQHNAAQHDAAAQHTVQL